MESNIFTTPIHPRGFLNRWLVLGAFPFGAVPAPDGPAVHVSKRKDEDWAATGFHPIPVNASGVMEGMPPQAGDGVRCGSVTAAWTPLDAHPDHTIFLPPLFKTGNNCLAYLFAVVKATRVATLRLRAERGAQVWVDGRPLALLYGRQAKIASTPAEGYFAFPSAPGPHEILIKCWQGQTAGMNGWGLQAQLLDAEGLPVQSGQIHLPMRDALGTRRMEREARCRELTMDSNIPAQGAGHLRLPDGIGAADVRVLRGAGKASWPVTADGQFGPVPPDAEDQVVEFRVQVRDPDAETPIIVPREAAILPRPEPMETDTQAAVLRAICNRHGTFESMVGLPIDESMSPAALVASYALGRPPPDPLAASRDALAFIDERRDCADFRMLWLLRWRRLFGDDPGAQALAREFEARMLRFIYAPEDSDEHTMCMGTENHRAMFWACEILAGEALPNARFHTTGKTGAWHAERARRGLRKWIEQKLAFGYAEWGSHYLMVDLDVLCTVRDFCADPATAALAHRLACKTLHLMVNDAWEGALAGARSRAYAPELLWPGIHRAASDVFALLGDPLARPVGDPFAIGLATSRTPIPANIRARLYHSGPRLIRERQGRDAPVLRTMYKTPDAVLASAVGVPQFGIMQRLHWWARLPDGISVFTTHPGPGTESHQHRPNYWSGTATPPRLGQARSALLCRYDIPADDAWGFTHAHWPSARFEETLTVNGWHVGRAGGGFIALRPFPEGRPVLAGRYGEREIQASGLRTGWICQIGRLADTGGFGDFVRAVRDAPAAFMDDRLVYTSPWEGQLVLHGDGRLLQNGGVLSAEVDLHIDAPDFTWHWGEMEPCNNPTSS